MLCILFPDVFARLIFGFWGMLRFLFEILFCFYDVYILGNFVTVLAFSFSSRFSYLLYFLEFLFWLSFKFHVFDFFVVLKIYNIFWEFQTSIECIWILVTPCPSSTPPSSIHTATPTTHTVMSFLITCCPCSCVRGLQLQCGWPSRSHILKDNDSLFPRCYQLSMFSLCHGWVHDFVQITGWQPHCCKFMGAVVLLYKEYVLLWPFPACGSYNLSVPSFPW